MLSDDNDIIQSCYKINVSAITVVSAQISRQAHSQRSVITLTASSSFSTGMAGGNSVKVMSTSPGNEVLEMLERERVREIVREIERERERGVKVKNITQAKLTESHG